MLESLSAFANRSLATEISFRLAPTCRQIWDTEIVHGELVADRALLDAQNRFIELEAIDGLSWSYRSLAENSNQPRLGGLARDLITHLIPTLSIQAGLEEKERSLWEKRFNSLGPLAWCYATQAGQLLAESVATFGSNLTTIRFKDSLRFRKNDTNPVHLPISMSSWTVVRCSESRVVATIPVVAFKIQQSGVAILQLSQIERETVDALLVYDSNKAIADVLGTTVRAINRRLSNIYRKLGFESRYELISSFLNSSVIARGSIDSTNSGTDVVMGKRTYSDREQGD